MTKVFQKIHLWLSIPFGIIITITCFSGAMLVFEQEVTRAARKQVYYVQEIKETPLVMDSLERKVAATLPDSVSVTGITVFDDPARTYQVNLSKPRKAAVFINQYTGEVTGRYQRLGFFDTMFRLHRWLLDSANPKGDGIKVGKLIVGISTLSFVFVLISGIVIWVPRARKKLGKNIRITVTNGWKSFLKSLHVAGGVYVALFLLTMALTGLTWSFGWYEDLFYGIFGGENLHGVIYSIHTGAFGGIVTKIIWFIAALLGSTLPLTGYYIWIKHLHKARKKSK